MSDKKERDLRACASRAVAMAALSAVAVEKNMGHFVSLYYCIGEPRICGETSEVFIRALLNTGAPISGFCTLVRAEYKPGAFPFKKVVVCLDASPNGDGHRFFACTFDENGIKHGCSWTEFPSDFLREE